ncbi:murein DD-endopeptidase MepM/ murein hydrolase activator NlpD [Sphingomonas jinjuensis]|uniref:Murein DD-endopeptidase MepM/ murein hydrolase activator NlpD n=1 Tax=Sphingomonas jinjuensis TaxID=535907 RepID=A0A840FE30_9SPHN|nr:murein DD-endopeptidase MepM/ murein hydrolase activator NlpD [Sphingomonas jinjuensis]
MFLRNDPGIELAGGTAGRSLARPVSIPAARPTLDRWRAQADRIDWVPDLGADIGSRDWWRGLATLSALLAATWVVSPGFDNPIVGVQPAPITGAAWDETRAQGIAPLAWGSDTGRRMAANDLVAPLREAPERPVIELAATLGDGDHFDQALQRAGVGRRDAAEAARLVAQTTSLGDIPSGTRIALTLGRRPSKTVARPLEKLALRARFDLAVSIDRAGQGLAMTRQPIAIDHTPLRIQGLVGSSLYRSARAAGAPAKVVEGYIKALATRLSIGSDVRAADSFDLVVERERAATGETRLGNLVLAGLDRARGKLQLVRFNDGQGEQWFDAAGQTQRRGFMGMPVAGRVTSTYGLRMHPLLGFMRMHKGMDIGAPYGAPIYAAIDGAVAFAGRSGGYGNFVKLAHQGGLATGYGHMSRIVVRGGQRVRQGQVIGYVGSTGMSTGPHLHWEVWRNGAAINPRSISFNSVATLTGAKLRAFKARLAGYLTVAPGR